MSGQGGDGGFGGAGGEGGRTGGPGGVGGQGGQGGPPADVMVRYYHTVVFLMCVIVAELMLIAFGVK